MKGVLLITSMGNRRKIRKLSEEMNLKLKKGNNVQNKLHLEIGKEEQTYFQHLDEYYHSFLPKQYKLSEKLGIQKRHIIIGLLAILAGFILYHTK